MAYLLNEPVHLYVKTHRLTGLKYFGRTVEDPYSYLGSGAYWIRHIARYGNDVNTRVIGTFTDEAQLRAAAKTFSAEHDIAASTDWANLLPEDGDVAGDGWTPGLEYSTQIEALDAAVERRLERVRRENEEKRRLEEKGRQEEKEKKEGATFAVCLVLVSIALGIYSQSSLGFLLGALAGLLTPIGWIPAGIAAWIVIKLSDSEA